MRALGVLQMVAGEADETSLLQYVDALVQRLRRLLGPALRGRPDPVHRARVTTRRLRAALALVDPAVSPAPSAALAKTLKRLGRRLGPLRDADVMLDCLNNLPPGRKLSGAVHWLRQGLRQRRKQALRGARRGISRGRALQELQVWRRLNGELTHARRHLGALLAQSLLRQALSLQRGADRLRQRPAAAPRRRRVDPHELRMIAKRLRYTLEMAAADGHDLPAQVAATFRLIQDLLGRWHDDVVLANHITELCAQEQLAYHNVALAQQVLELVRRLLRRSDRCLAAVAQLWVRRGRFVTRAVRAQAHRCGDDPRPMPVGR